jgi:MrcB-like, N-terminal domain/Domain of unknown function (DUF3883)
MREELLEVISLQRDYSSQNTPAMQRRGELVRRVIRDELKSIAGRLRLALGVHGDDLAFQGRDGTGNKTIIPWVRYFSKARSPSAQKGWYCVYLFDAPGTGVYLELGHGSTTLQEGDYHPRPPEELARLVSWGRQTLSAVIERDGALGQLMTLKGEDLGAAYEQSSVLAKWYPANALPNDHDLFNDAVEFAGYLKLIYDAETLGLAPTSLTPEILEVESVASGHPPHRSRVQGFGLSPPERHAVEMHAMARAKAHLKNLGWRVRDVSSTHPYDFECTRGTEELIVEVKGTTSTGEQIVFTRNEVATHRARHPNNALIVVHSINLTRSFVDPKVNGGELLMWSPWTIEEERLRPLAFQYSVPLA